jgi:hypothetical protein
VPCVEATLQRSHAKLTPAGRLFSVALAVSRLSYGLEDILRAVKRDTFVLQHLLEMLFAPRRA